MAKKEDILELAAERFKVCAEYDRDEREMADEDLRFAVNDEGCQWDKGVKESREGDSPPRPCLVLNKIPEKIDQVQGEFEQLRPSIKVRAVDSVSDPKTAEVIAGIYRHIEYDSKARGAYNHSHASVLYCGRGAWRVDVVDSLDDPFVRDIKINRIPNVFTVYWDPYAKQADKSDADYFFVTELVPKKEFEKEHKDVVENWPDDDFWNEWKSGEAYRVAEYWWKEKKEKTFYQVERTINGIPTRMTVENPEETDFVVDEREVKWPQVRWCKMVAGKIIEGPEDWPGKYIPIVLEFGKEVNIRGKEKTRGMVRFAKTPQQMYNYWSSAVTEQIALAPKAPYLVTASMVSKYQGIWDRAHEKNFPFLPYDPDPTAPNLTPRREPPPAMSPALQHEFARMDHDIMASMGIYQAMLGDEGQEVSGRAILARQRQGNIGSYPYTDNFHVALTHSARIVIDLVPYVYDTERIMRVLGPDGDENSVPINARVNPATGAVAMPNAPQVPEQYMGAPRQGITEYLNDITVGKYDVAVTIGPSYTTQREETLAVMMDMVKSAPQIVPMIMDLVVENMDMPHADELIKRLKKMVPVEIRGLEEGEEPPQQQQDPKLMLEMAKLELKKEDNERRDFETQMRALRDMAEIQVKKQGVQLEALISMMEHVKGRLDHDHEARLQDKELKSQKNTAKGNK